MLGRGEGIYSRLPQFLAHTSIKMLKFEEGQESKSCQVVISGKTCAIKCYVDKREKKRKEGQKTKGRKRESDRRGCLAVGGGEKKDEPGETQAKNRAVVREAEFLDADDDERECSYRRQHEGNRGVFTD